MSSALQSAKRYRAIFLATTVLAFNATLAHAQNVASTDLPPVEVSPPTDQNKTRARPTYDESGGTPRPARTAAPSRGTGTDRPMPPAQVPAQAPAAAAPAPVCGSSTASSAPSSTVITAEDIAHSPSNNLPDILAQVPGVQLTSLFGSAVNGVKTSVDLRGFGAFALSNTLILVNGRRLNDVDMSQVDLSTIPLNSIERIEIIPRQQRRSALWRQRDRRRHQHRHQERRRRPAGRRSAARPASARSTRAWPTSPPRPTTGRGRPRSTATRSSPTAIATTTRSTR